MSRNSLPCSVTGPGKDRPCQSPEVGLSLATTFASRAGEECTYYVRDERGDVTGRVERDERGLIRVYSLLKGTKR